ncbi:neuroendocrine convertase 1-like [Planococcus citri]|uniref:neuroendocrine convertase 1-like n=1 Tax=Planococcus citri TaxID=170843 RepID=UPI0031F9098E
MVNVRREFSIIILLVFDTFISAKYLIEEESLIHDPHHKGKEDAVYFSNKWIVKTNNIQQVIDFAKIKGFKYYKWDDDFEEYYVLENPDHPEEHHEENEHHTNSLMDHDNIIWAQQLYGKKLHRKDSFEDEHSLYIREYNDELWSLQWYEVGVKSDATTTTKAIDMNLVPVYKVFNITGNGVRILIIDDGIEYTHDDIKDNFDAEISFNFNQNKSCVLPRYEDPRNCHGTRCAGVAVMKANNEKCGVGIAYNAKVGGITLLDGIINDVIESKAIKYAIDKVDIYSGSWGPQDNGIAFDGPGHLSSVALQYGALKGRNGLGALYVFAAGNGGTFGDHCGADGYVNNIYSFAIASVTQDGQIPYYSERCPAILATTYSGSLNDKVKIVTTDLHNTCTLSHSGTSASAPLAAGIFALVLEANKNLTWRDMYHIVIWTAEVTSLERNVDWAQNGFGLWYTPQFGFGLMDAFKMVSLAMDWQNVPEKYICMIPFEIDKNENTVSSGPPFIAVVRTDACHGAIRYLEHVQLNVTISYPVRGCLEIDLVSPLGTLSKVMEARKNDYTKGGFKNWAFLSLQFWGEDPSGDWMVMVTDKLSRGKEEYRGTVEQIQLIVHGTTEVPRHYIETEREYVPFL